MGTSCNEAESQKHKAMSKKVNTKDYTLYAFIYMNVQKRQIYRDGKRIHSIGLRIRMDPLYKQTENSEMVGMFYN